MDAKQNIDRTAGATAFVTTAVAAPKNCIILYVVTQTAYVRGLGFMINLLVVYQGVYVQPCLSTLSIRATVAHTSPKVLVFLLEVCFLSMMLPGNCSGEIRFVCQRFELCQPLDMCWYIASCPLAGSACITF